MEATTPTTTTARPVGIVSCSKRPTFRTADAMGHITTRGGDWEVIMTDGRSFAHRNKALVLRVARTYAQGGEAALAGAR